jgi:hypothetical protein
MEDIMKGTISNIEKSQITMKDGTKKDKYTITFEGDDKKYEAWSCDHKIGAEVEGEVSEREWSGKIYYSIKFSGGSKGGGFQPRGKSPEELKLQLRSFCAAYAKDVTVSIIEKGNITTSKEIDATLQHYFILFRGLLEA